MGAFEIISGFKGSSNEPIHHHQQLSKAAQMGPSIMIGSFSRQLKWAHPSSSACFKGSLNEPIQGHQQLSNTAQMGPSIIISMFPRQLKWAHSWSSAAFKGSSHRPIQCQWCFHKQLPWAHSRLLAPFVGSSHGPIQGSMAPFIGGFHEPIQDHWQLSYTTPIGPFDINTYYHSMSPHGLSQGTQPFCTWGHWPCAPPGWCPLHAPPPSHVSLTCTPSQLIPRAQPWRQACICLL